MLRAFRSVLVLLLFFTTFAAADHVIVCGGPALRKWEDLRIPDDQHDRWWANFVRGSTLRMAEVRLQYGSEAPLVWFVYRPGYETRGREDGKPYIKWIQMQADKRNCKLIWFDSTKDFLSKFNSRPSRSIQTFDYFGHSNKYAFMFDYGNDIMAACVSVLHERDLPKVRSSVFARDAFCKSWGCHTGSSMSAVWKKQIGTSLIGARGKTVYTMVGRGQMPKGYGGWTR